MDAPPTVRRVRTVHATPRRTSPQPASRPNRACVCRYSARSRRSVRPRAGPEQLVPHHARHPVTAVHPAEPVLALLLLPQHLAHRPVGDPAVLPVDVLHPAVELEQVPPDPQVDLGPARALGDHVLGLRPADVELEHHQPQQRLADGLGAAVGDPTALRARVTCGQHVIGSRAPGRAPRAAPPAAAPRRRRRRRPRSRAPGRCRPPCGPAASDALAVDDGDVTPRRSAARWCLTPSSVREPVTPGRVTCTSSRHRGRIGIPSRTAAEPWEGTADPHLREDGRAHRELRTGPRRRAAPTATARRSSRGGRRPRRRPVPVTVLSSRSV